MMLGTMLLNLRHLLRINLGFKLQSVDPIDILF